MIERAVSAVREFHEKFGLPVLEEPSIPLVDRRQLRLGLILEEFAELTLAVNKGDIVGVADGAADLLYVVLGLCLEFGIPISRVFEEVHRSNMSKIWPDGSVRKRGDGKVLKPPSYSPADIESVLWRHGAAV